MSEDYRRELMRQANLADLTVDALVAAVAHEDDEGLFTALDSCSRDELEQALISAVARIVETG